MPALVHRGSASNGAVWRTNLGGLPEPPKRTPSAKTAAGGGTQGDFFV